MTKNTAKKKTPYCGAKESESKANATMVSEEEKKQEEE